MWIELHDTAREHPKVLKLAKDLKIPPAHALGHLCSLWLWTLRMAPDGDLSSFERDDLEIAAGWLGEDGVLIDAMIKRRLIVENGDGLAIHDWDEYATHLKAAERKRKQRERKKRSRDVTGHTRNVTGCHRTGADTENVSRGVTLTDQTDQTDQTRTDQTRPEPTVARTASQSELVPASPPVITLPTTKGEHPINQQDVLEWSSAYPGVDVHQALRSMRQWCISNPSKQKTPRGIRRFVTSWLDRAQNRGGGNSQKATGTPFSRSLQAMEAWANETK